MFRRRDGYVNDEDEQKKMEYPVPGNAEAVPSEEAEFPKQFEPAFRYCGFGACGFQAFGVLQHAHLYVVTGNFCVAASHGWLRDLAKRGRTEEVDPVGKQKLFTKVMEGMENRDLKGACYLSRRFLC